MTKHRIATRRTFTSSHERDKAKFFNKCQENGVEIVKIKRIKRGFLDFGTDVTEFWLRDKDSKPIPPESVMRTSSGKVILTSVTNPKIFINASPDGKEASVKSSQQSPTTHQISCWVASQNPFLRTSPNKGIWTLTSFPAIRGLNMINTPIPTRSKGPI